MNDDLFPAPPPPPPAARPRPPGLTRDVTLADQITCVKRELGMRARVYGYRVRERKMTQAESDWEINVMSEVLRTLEDLQRAGVVGNGPRP